MDIKKVIDNLIEKKYDVKLFSNKEEASQYLNDELNNETIGIGGSSTVQQMGLYESLKAHNTVYWHWDLSIPRTQFEIKKDAENADYYICSVNGMSEDGILINIDGNCNRLASTFFGHKKVFFIIGTNKIAKDFDSALYRARNVAAPLNAQRLKVDTPCAVKADKCYDCKSPQRICSGYSVFWNAPKGVTKYEIILVEESLGF